MATIYDVGKIAGVSVATVSSVINNTSYVSPELRKRVEAAIKERDYSPNLLARGLARQKSMTLGVLVPDIANFFFAEVVRGIEDRAIKAGYTIVVGNSDNKLDREEVYLKLFLAQRVDGILLVKSPGYMSPSLLQSLNKNGPPVVLLDREYPDFRTDSVVVDDMGGGYLGTKHLLDLGHRRIGIICGVAGVSTTDGRLRGYEKALSEAHAKIDSSLVFTGDYSIESGYTSGVALLERKPKAVFITNYMMTMGFLRAIGERNLSTPDDISIVSYDDFIWNDIFAPHLTSVMQPKYKLGYTAAEILLSRIRNKKRHLQTIVMENSLRIRESSAKVTKRVTRT
jgi:DNA-binding LacI/PurR family transcriptional regulator